MSLHGMHAHGMQADTGFLRRLYGKRKKKTYSTVTGAILRVSAPGIDTPSPAFCDAFIAGGAAGFPLASVSVSS